MGASHSNFLSNPEQFATRVTQSQTSSKVKEYDFVIVGGGTAGCVLASKLSENPAFTVILIEAGRSHEEYLFSKIPLGFSKLFLSAADWAFSTTPQKHVKDRVIRLPRGKVLGGTRDFNTPGGTLGAAPFLAFMDNKGQRSSAAAAYLTNNVLAWPNLSVAVNCCVEKVLFDDENNTLLATGVELRTTRDGPIFCVSATKEIILTAGAYGTPHLLLVSGIGPRKELEEKGVTVVKDLPAVGKNLVDGLPTYDYLAKPLSSLFALVQWYITGKWPMATLAAQGAAFFRSDDPSLPYSVPGGKPLPDLVDLSSGSNAPDLEISWFPMLILDGGVGKIPPGVQGATARVVNLRPKSSGDITLETSSIWDKPIINPKWFSNEHDTQIVARGVRLLLRIARTKPFSGFVDFREDERYPFLWIGTQDPDTLSEEELYEFIRKNSKTAWHPVSQLEACTARMGKSEDSSVVNSKLQVHGMQSLKIIDASIFPKQLSGHPCTAIIAMAEKASDMIKEAHI
ncbi:hypothetical protein Clacol_007948 [Clathrus columnatus]|uniref:Glucose-methanol-choline oxidoreductase N-terminal domain-containing protein n=1 Tax=Clathrus columnatus TaxID=1419009 RepID=A0AAV5AJ26_9AGAM|nr:hypothetical protein Clacol_007948 [Clathrus columnatus]